ncbi:hypothetical protein [Sphingomonas sp. LT1P40]|uniref:hypothetical protein n=1 Tax=Alteristakelama amylovorans TaxID=3096166 RepID=UPI002FC78828
MRIVAMMAGLAAVAGCAGAAPADNAETGNLTVTQDAPKISSKPVPGELPARPLLNVAPGAIALVDAKSGSSRELAFGAEKDVVLTAVGRALDAPVESGVNRECGEGAMDYAKFKGGPALWFQEGKLVGWFLDDAKSRVTTASGTGIGSVRSEVADALAISDQPDSTLGREFSTENGTLSGLLDGAGDQAKVTALWSGQVCLFR